MIPSLPPRVDSILLYEKSQLRLDSKRNIKTYEQWDAIRDKEKVGGVRGLLKRLSGPMIALEADYFIPVIIMTPGSSSLIQHIWFIARVIFNKITFGIGGIDNDPERVRFEYEKSKATRKHDKDLIKMAEKLNQPLTAAEKLNQQAPATPPRSTTRSVVAITPASIKQDLKNGNDSALIECLKDPELLQKVLHQVGFIPGRNGQESNSSSTLVSISRSPSPMDSSIDSSILKNWVMPD